MSWILERYTIPNKRPSCHASTILQTKTGYITSYFAGMVEGHPTTSIYINHYKDGQWQPQVAVAGYAIDKGWMACWNPVLFRIKDTIQLYYKRGTSPLTWATYVMESTDEGQSWKEPRQIGQAGPVKNKPVMLPSGKIIAPSSNEIVRPGRSPTDAT